MIDSVEVNDRLRRIIRSYRTNPARWGTPRGLTQAQAAARAGISEVWWRSVELAYGSARFVSPQRLAAMCTAVEIESFVLRGLGYMDVADLMDGIDNSGWDDEERTKAHILATPGLNEEEKDVLLQALKAARAIRTEPMGQDGWQRR